MRKVTRTYWVVLTLGIGGCAGWRPTLCGMNPQCTLSRQWVGRPERALLDEAGPPERRTVTPGAVYDEYDRCVTTQTLNGPAPNASQNCQRAVFEVRGQSIRRVTVRQSN